MSKDLGLSGATGENIGNGQDADVKATNSFPLVKLKYQGGNWTAQRLENAPSYVIFKNEENPRDGMTWSAPESKSNDLAWRIYHANHQPTRGELFGMLSIIESFQTLIYKTQREQVAILGAMKNTLKKTDMTQGDEQPSGTSHAAPATQNIPQ